MTDSNKKHDKKANKGKTQKLPVVTEEMIENATKETSQEAKRDMSYTQNRELSWLTFDDRILDIGEDPTVPVLERLKFVSIFTSNLDEFFMVRVGSMHNLSLLKKDAIDNKSGWTPEEQLQHIYARIPALYEKRDRIMADLEVELRKQGIANLHVDELNKKEAEYLDEFFYHSVLPVLSPIVIDARHPFPHLLNNHLYAFADLKDKQGNAFYGLLSLPAPVPPLIFLPNSAKYVLLEDIIRDKFPGVFEGFSVNSLAIISVTRNADINLEEDIDDMEENIRHQMKKALKKRNRLAAVRLEIQGSLPKDSVNYLLGKLDLSKQQLYYSKTPLRMKYVFAIEDQLDPKTALAACYRKFSPQPSRDFDMAREIIPQILEKDKLLHFPYESMDPYLQLLKEASVDPSVISIKITIYRMASVSKVAEYLAQAAENGKEVLALMELRARFDEENNIDYSERLEQAGCTIIYGFEDYKVHSKISLITRHAGNKLQYITQIGTGNYNEKTARQYTDFSFLTANEEIGRDATAFFKNMLISKLDGKYKHLLVAPTGIKPALMNLFDREIDRARNGLVGRVVIKCNSVTERDLIDKMMEASNAGVKVTLIVRGICCIRPGIPGKTENVRVISIVGRFLEHHRVYLFGEHGEDLYISSADLMTRNISRRVELAVPLYDKDVREELLHAIEIFLSDDEKAQELQADGTYVRVENRGGLSAQSYFMKEAMQQGRRKNYHGVPQAAATPLDPRSAVEGEKFIRLERKMIEDALQNADPTIPQTNEVTTEPEIAPTIEIATEPKIAPTTEPATQGHAGESQPNLEGHDPNKATVEERERLLEERERKLEAEQQRISELKKMSFWQKLKHLFRG